MSTLSPPQARWTLRRRRGRRQSDRIGAACYPRCFYHDAAFSSRPDRARSALLGLGRAVVLARPACDHRRDESRDRLRQRAVLELEQSVLRRAPAARFTFVLARARVFL